MLCIENRMKEGEMGIRFSIMIVAMFAMHALCLAQGGKGSNENDNDSPDDGSNSGRAKWRLERRFYLGQNFPDPFVLSDKATIEYKIAGAPYALLNVYDSDGRIHLSIYLPGDKNTVTISGEQLTPGSYTYALVVYGRIVEKKEFNLRP
ncbi:MAG: hypothetical protein DI538_11995 [Azospira oryzae]|jgi:hypothetical protein|nr:MAG: hypothetical protein DI538_11995 [Azospira oryzae]